VTGITSVLWVLGLSFVAPAQSVDPNLLLQPPPDSWLTFHGGYSGQRHTSLAQITPENVATLQQVWRFQTGQNQQIKASPIVAGGVIYVTTPDNIWAVDARTAKELWHYQNPPNNAFHIGHRGAAIYKDTVYLTTPDCHLIALNAKDGKVKWNVVIGDSSKGYWSTNAPLVVRNHVLVGVSGDFDNLPGQLKSIDADTGATQWIFYSTPPPGSKEPTRQEPDSGGATGGQMWTTGTYDPDLNLVFVGTGNPTPVLNGAARPGDNPWTCSIVALNPDTGRLVWGFQVSPHDTHDWDANEVPVLVDADFSGAPRKLLMQASRNGYFFVLDRTTGKSLLTTPFATVNWAKGIDPEGRPVPDPAKFPARNGVLIAPNESGATNFRPPSFDPGTGLFIVSAQDGYGIYFFKPDHGAYGWAGADYGIAGRAFLRAIDYKTGKIVWNHPIGEGAGTAGVLTTQTGVTFSGDVSGNVLALRTSDGATLWHQALGKIGNGPISYELDGRQYLLVGGDSSLYAFALPLAAQGSAPTKAPIRAPIRPPTKVMLLDGESAGAYHKWQLTTPVLRKELEETGLFQVDVVTAPPAGGDFSAFQPDFSKYAVVVWNYDAPDERWPAELKASFENYVRAGGGFVSVHAADNAFPNWAAFDEMIGVGGWRGRTEKNGPFWYLKDRQLVSDPAPGDAGSHGRRTPFQIAVRQDHPITNGLPRIWMHQGDELYSRLRGPGKNMSVLATAFSDPANSGTGHDEPVLMTLSYGRGRVFHTTLGHDINALSSVDFVVTFQRGTEWAATGNVTQKVPADFPTANSVSYRADIAAMDPGYKRGLNPLDAAPAR